MPVMTELFLIRHGEAVINLEPSLDGICLGLTERGRGQAALLRERLAAEEAAGRAFGAAYHSPRARSAETAAIVRPGIGVPIAVCEDLRSMDHGEPGVDIWNFATNALGTIPPLAPDSVPNPGAEVWRQYLDRSGRALMAIAEKHAGQRVLVIGHAETSESAMVAFMRLPAGSSSWTYPLVNHTSVGIWRHVRSDLPGADPAGQWALRVHNNDGHLPAEDRTW
jgi:2,3-bisphosphoglycerate-dependent phosphoglycerate mutase